MAVRNIIKIDKDKCNGCGKCVSACAEGAIEIVNGKAQLVSESYCDGLGACIGDCPMGAITVEQREAEEFDEKAVEDHLAKKGSKGGGPEESESAAEKVRSGGEKISFGCPGMMAKQFDRPAPTKDSKDGDVSSQLSNWPVQLKLVSPSAGYFKDAELLLAADCVPFAMGDFHSKLLAGKPVTMGCPKLDDSEYYVDKLTEILVEGGVKGLTVVHMEVPCCTGLVKIAERAVEKSGLSLPVQRIKIGINGDILEQEKLKLTRTEVAN